MNPAIATRLGIVIPAANTTLEAELPRFGADGVTWHFQRFGQLISDQADLESGMAAIVESAAVLTAARVSAVGVGYTAGSYTGGPAWDARLRAAIAEHTECPVHTAASAIVDALARLRVHSVAVVSPYSVQVNARATRYLTASGFTVTHVVGEPPPGRAGDVAPEEIETIVQNLDRTGAECVLISCTGLRTLALIPDLEQTLNLPVVSSNLALLWALSSAPGVPGPGTRQRSVG